MDKAIIGLLKKGGVGVVPTDTIYGLVGCALLRQTVEKIYTLRQRDVQKPLIILISSLDDLKIFNIELSTKTKKILSQFWPGPVSIILPCNDDHFFYLHRGTNSLAFRIPDKPPLLALIKKVGPLVAPSANLEGQPPAQTIKQANKYFGDKVSFYIDGGKICAPPSTIISLEKNKITLIRP